MEILGNLVHPRKSILVTGELPDSVGDQDDKLPAHQPGLSVPCTQTGEKTQKRLYQSRVTEEPMAGVLLQEGMLQFRLQLRRLLVHSPARAPLKKSRQPLLLNLLQDSRGAVLPLIPVLTRAGAFRL